MTQKQITKPTQSYMNKQKYLAQHVIDSHMRRTLMLITDKTMLHVKSASQKVIADKFCERFGINCTVMIVTSKLPGLSCDKVIVCEVTDNESMKNIHFTRMLSKMLNK